jgi:sulfur-oxidizing protein SoxX
MTRALGIALMLALAGTAYAQVTNYRVEGDGIPQALTNTPGNAARGRALIAKREAANCLQCHAIKDLPGGGGGGRGPALDGVGARLTQAQLRLSVVDYARVMPKVEMPSFHRADSRPATDKEDAGKPILTAQEIEDVVAYLATLRYR